MEDVFKAVSNHVPDTSGKGHTLRVCVDNYDEQAIGKFSNPMLGGHCGKT